MSEEIKVVYRDSEITYNENSNTWNAECFSKPADTLANAKTRIDAKLDKEKRVPFNRFEAFVKRLNYDSGTWPLVTITSVTDDGKQAWAAIGKEREKIGSHYGPEPLKVFPNTPENAELVAKIHALEKQTEEILKSIEVTEKKLKVWKPD
jgi:hypothetical protein